MAITQDRLHQLLLAAEEAEDTWRRVHDYVLVAKTQNWDLATLATLVQADPISAAARKTISVERAHYNATKSKNASEQRRRAARRAGLPPGQHLTTAQVSLPTALRDRPAMAQPGGPLAPGGLTPQFSEAELDRIAAEANGPQAMALSAELAARRKWQADRDAEAEDPFAEGLA